ncbi:hypothetical protein BJP34_10215 [Moorena producens PAL-8-15-08-1]|uniref:Uncharacterized protein n=1 Tax=Moorena producens PAL-8-15-08-1 TaxID=1458985 RepID=A0A1D8TQ60_9CYAN|nr:hypothetical protein BJP34_10215 [Moorena producens PAL-8-15-08-1]
MNDTSADVSIQLSAISYQLSAISYQLSAISYQLSTISYQLSAISLWVRSDASFAQRGQTRPAWPFGQGQSLYHKADH